jgi:hypothetical protein
MSTQRITNRPLSSTLLRLQRTRTSNRLTTAETRTSFVRRCVDLVTWTISSAILALVPKCPMCLAAYLAAWTGLGLSVSAATHLRWSLLILATALILFLTAKIVVLDRVARSS